MDILSIAPRIEPILIGENEVDVRGVSLRFITSLIARFPDVTNVLDGKGMEISKLLAASPDAALAIMAKGCGIEGDVRAKPLSPELAVLDELPVDDQIDILTAIFRLSFKRNYRPFVEMVSSQLGLKLTMNGAAVEAVPETSDESLPSVSSS